MENDSSLSHLLWLQESLCSHTTNDSILFKRPCVSPALKFCYLNLLMSGKKNNAHLSFIVHPCHFILCHLSSSFWVICSCGQNEAGIVPQKLQNLSKGQNDNRLFGIVMGIPTWWRYNDRLCWKLSIWLMKIFAVAAGASQHYAVPWSLGTLRSVLSYLKTKNNSHSSVISTVCRGKNM